MHSPMKCYQKCIVKWLKCVLEKLRHDLIVWRAPSAFKFYVIPKKSFLNMYFKLTTVIFGKEVRQGRESICEEEFMHHSVIFNKNIMMCVCFNAKMKIIWVVSCSQRKVKLFYDEVTFEWKLKICMHFLAQPLGWEDPLEKGKATHFSILACRLYSLWGHKELDMTERLSLSLIKQSLWDGGRMKNRAIEKSLHWHILSV